MAGLGKQMNLICRALVTAISLGTVLGPVTSTAQTTDVRTVQVGRVELDVADFIAWTEEKGALVGRWPGSDVTLLHISIYSVVRDGKTVPGAGAKILAAQARDDGIALQENESRVWYHDYKGRGPRAELHTWYVGFDAHVVFITCAIDEKDFDSDRAKAVLESIPLTINSVRLPTKARQPSQ